MRFIKWSLSLSMVGITIFVLSASAWNGYKQDALTVGNDWDLAYTFQYDQNNQVIIDHNNYNYIEQGSNIVNSVYKPIEFIYETLEIIDNTLTRFFNLDITSQETFRENNELEYQELFDLYLGSNWDQQVYQEYLSYYYRISSTQDIAYHDWNYAYELETYFTILGLRLWKTSSVQLTYQELYDLDQLYDLGA